MKKREIIVFIVIILTIIGLIIIIALTVNSLVNQAPKKKDIQVETIQYNRHDYLLFKMPYSSTTAIVHSPDCQECYAIYD